MKNYPIALLSPFARFKAAMYRFLKWPYLIFTLCCYLLIAAVVILYLDKTPVYKSELELVLLVGLSERSLFCCCWEEKIKNKRLNF